MKLSDVSIPQPCPMSWRELVGDHRQRYCARCERSVVNLSALTPREVEEALASNDDVCVAVRFAEGPTELPSISGRRRSHGIGRDLLNAVAMTLAMLVGESGRATAGDSAVERRIHPDNDHESTSISPDVIGQPSRSIPGEDDPEWSNPTVVGRMAPLGWTPEPTKTPGPLPDEKLRP